MDSQTSLTVKRAAINLVFACNYPHRMPYTESEQREALYQVATGAMKCPAALWSYGVPIKTINNHLQKLRVSLGFADNDEMRKSCEDPAQRQTLLTRCKSLDMVKPGGQPYMSPDLLALFKEIATLHDNSSAGWDQRTLSAKARTIVQGLGEEMLQGAQTEGERKSAKHLISAKCSSHWLEGNILDPEVQVFTKKSDQSHKRTAASNPLLDFVMRTKMDEVYQAHHALTILATRRPRADQVWNGDEIGIPPNGKYRATYNNRVQRGLRGFRMVTGEKNPFWATLFYFTRGDGARPVPPMVIHQGGKEKRMRASAGIYLPDGWLSHCTTSGYMDRAGVRALAQGFVQHSGASAANPQYLYWDGHDSHWDADALDYFAKNHVFVFFLKANDSANGQPNDMGPNRNWKAIYATVVGEWQAAHPIYATVHGVDEHGDRGNLGEDDGVRDIR